MCCEAIKQTHKQTSKQVQVLRIATPAAIFIYCDNSNFGHCACRYLLGCLRGGRASFPGLLGTFLSLRDASVEVVEGVVAWRWGEASRGLPVFLWNGVDYLHKMCNDMDFLGSCSPLVREPCWPALAHFCVVCALFVCAWASGVPAFSCDFMGLTSCCGIPVVLNVSSRLFQVDTLGIAPGVLRANPFMLPVNLAERAISMAQQGAARALGTIACQQSSLGYGPRTHVSPPSALICDWFVRLFLIHCVTPHANESTLPALCNSSSIPRALPLTLLMTVAVLSRC